jgi:hypothetical protein
MPGKLCAKECLDWRVGQIVSLATPIAAPENSLGWGTRLFDAKNTVQVVTEKKVPSLPPYSLCSNSHSGGIRVSGGYKSRLYNSRGLPFTSLLTASSSQKEGHQVLQAYPYRVGWETEPMSQVFKGGRPVPLGVPYLQSVCWSSVPDNTRCRRSAAAALLRRSPPFG